LENTVVYDTLKNSNIEGYLRYVNDILLVYNEELTDIKDVLNSLNSIAPSLNFTVEMEQDNKLNFLDLTISKTAEKFSFNIFRKPTTSDTIIPNDSCHPSEQKTAAIRYFANRIKSYELDQDSKQKEVDTVKQIIHNNKYDSTVLERALNKKEKEKDKGKQGKESCKQKWAKFTYVGNETRLVTKLLKNTAVKVTYTTNNLGKILNMHKNQKQNKYDKNGVYQLTCPTWSKRYVGQTSRPFHVRYREHYQDYKYGNNKSKFVQHATDEGHAFGPINEVMDVIQFAKKGRLLDTLERFYIYNETAKGNQINDKLTMQKNPIFETLI
jgi:hypothetical protein